MRGFNCPKAPQVNAMLKESAYFNRNYGHDHFVLHVLNQVLVYFNSKPQCRQFLKTVCANCSKLAIDTYPKVVIRSNIFNMR